MSSLSKRPALDMRDLGAWCGAHSVAFEMVDDEPGLLGCHVLLPGPEDTPYAGGNYTVSIILPKAFPFKSPSVAFQTPIWHPNVEVEKGGVCLDVINDKWTPITRLVTVVETYLPQLLRHPNKDDPLNAAAASMMHNDLADYTAYVKLHTAKYASGAAAAEDIVLPRVPYDSDGEYDDDDADM